MSTHTINPHIITVDYTIFDKHCIHASEYSPLCQCALQVKGCARLMGLAAVGDNTDLDNSMRLHSQKILVDLNLAVQYGIATSIIMKVRRRGCKGRPPKRQI